MKFKKLLAILLCVLLTVGLLSGCGGTASNDTVASEAASEPEAASEAPAPQPETPAEPEASAEEASVVEEIPEEPEITISYPLSEEPVTLTIMATCFPDVSSMLDGQLINTYACTRAFEVTNVSLDSTLFLDATPFLMAVTSGDYPDLFAGNLRDYYTGGRTAMYEDGVVIDISDMLQENAPNYCKYFNGDESFKKQLTLDDGAVVSMSVYGKPINQGAMIRQDLLDKVGMEVPKTFDELEKVLDAFVNGGYVETGLTVTGVLSADHYAGFSNGFDVYTGGTTLEYQVEDGKVNMNLMTEQYLDYITLLTDWYKKGLLYKEFYSFTDMDTNGVLLNSVVGFSYSGVDFMDPNFFVGSSAEGADWIPINEIRRNEGDTLSNGPIMQRVNTCSELLISSTCEYPEIAVSYFDWFFSEEGAMAYNLGQEGVTYTGSEEEGYRYTDLIINNPQGLAVRQARWLYAGIDVMPFLYVTEWQDDPAAINDNQKNAVSVWTENETEDGLYAGDMTPEETETYTGYASDLGTYVEAELPRFVLGERSLDDWDNFIDELCDLGAEELVALKQAAYDRYMNR